MIKNKLPRLRTVAALAASVATVATGAALLAAAPAAASSTQAVAVSDTLLPGQSLKPGQFIRSKSGVYTLKMERDGWASLSRPGYPASWSTPTSRPGAVLRLQTDGNLVVIYGRTKIWASGTDGSTNTKLVVQNDGDLVLFNARGKAVWNRHMIIGTLASPGALRTDLTMVSRNRVYRLQVQKNGDFQLLKGKTVLWNTKTGGHPGAYVLVEKPGGLVVLSADKKELWSTKTNHSTAVLALRDTGTAELIYGRTVVWSTKTAR